MLVASNHAYKRVGKTKQQISSSEIRKLAAEVKKKLNWDELTCEEAGLECIDEEKFGWFLKEGIKQRGLNLSEDSPLEEALVRLKLLRKGKLTNAALLLFSKEPIFLQSEVKCIRFSGNEPIKPYIDFQTIEQNVFDLINLAEDFILRNIRKSIWLIPDKVQREEKYEYPPDAIREAIVNALAHRDYESVSKVQVRVFDNRIEIWSPGKRALHYILPNYAKTTQTITQNKDD
jgi:ATP-dependent DNA helicase RecG